MLMARSAITCSDLTPALTLASRFLTEQMHVKCFTDGEEAWRASAPAPIEMLLSWSVATVQHAFSLLSHGRLLIVCRGRWQRFVVAKLPYKVGGQCVAVS